MKPVPGTTFAEHLDRFVRWFFDVSPNVGVDPRRAAEQARVRREKKRLQQPHLQVQRAGSTRQRRER